MKLIRCCLPSVVTLLAVIPLMGGGFYLEAENGNEKGTALIVRTLGCHQPSNAQMTARAEGLVDGRRKTIPLTMRHTQKGVFTVSREWPSEGQWVITVTGIYNGQTRSLLIPEGKVKGAARQVDRRLESHEIEQVLQAMNKRRSPKSAAALH